MLRGNRRKTNRRAAEVDDRAREPVDRGLPPGVEVGDQPIALVRQTRGGDGSGDIAHVDEVAGLLAVAINEWWISAKDVGHECGNCGRILAGRVLPRPKHIEVTQADSLQAERPSKGPAIVLTGQLGRGVR